MSLKHILSQPEYIKDIGYIYPIKLKDYDEFTECSSLLYISKGHFQTIEYPLLTLLFMSKEHLGLSLEDLVYKFSKLFSLVTQKDVGFASRISNRFEGFIIDNQNIISNHNYDKIREVIMKQNLMHEQKIYKTELMQKWAEKAIKAKQKTAPNISFEDIVSSVSVGCSKNYSDLENYTIYQIYSDFYRLRKMVDYDANIQFRCAGADLKFQDYAENLDLFHNPYDDLFVSADKLGGLNKAIKQSN